MLDEAAEWSEKTFPQSTIDSVTIHLFRELQELVDSKFTDPSEFADVVLLLNHLAFKKGFSLDDAVEDKFEVNKKRKWGPVDSEGVVEHVRDKKSTVHFMKLDKDGRPYGIGHSEQE